MACISTVSGDYERIRQFVAVFSVFYSQFARSLKNNHAKTPILNAKAVFNIFFSA